MTCRGDGTPAGRLRAGVIRAFGSRDAKKKPGFSTSVVGDELLGVQQGPEDVAESLLELVAGPLLRVAGLGEVGAGGGQLGRLGEPAQGAEVGLADRALEVEARRRLTVAV